MKKIWWVQSVTRAYKKTMLYLSMIVLWLWVLIALPLSVDARGTPGLSSQTKDFPFQTWRGTEATTDMGKIMSETNQKGSLLDSFLTMFGINYADQWQGKAIVYVQVVINYVLSLLGIISVVLIIYSFYAILFTTKSDEAIQKAKKTVVWATIGLFLVALSAYIVNFIFYIYNKGL